MPCFTTQKNTFVLCMKKQICLAFIFLMDIYKKVILKIRLEITTVEFKIEIKSL